MLNNYSSKYSFLFLFFYNTYLLPTPLTAIHIIYYLYKVANGLCADSFFRLCMYDIVLIIKPFDVSITILCVKVLLTNSIKY